MTANVQKNGGACDHGLFWNSDTKKCDPYLKIYLNGEPFYESDKDEKEKNANKHEVTIQRNFKTPKIRKDSMIKFEVWDDDVGNPDDLLFEKTINVGSLVEASAQMVIFISVIRLILSI